MVVSLAKEKTNKRFRYKIGKTGLIKILTKEKETKEIKKDKRNKST